MPLSKVENFVNMNNVLMKAQQWAARRLVYHAFPEWSNLIVVVWTDAGHVNRPNDSSMEGLLIGARQLACRWVNGDAQLANPLTKPGEKHQLEDFYTRGGKWRLVMDPQFMSAKQRKSCGIDPLANRSWWSAVIETWRIRPW